MALLDDTKRMANCLKDYLKKVTGSVRRAHRLMNLRRKRRSVIRMRNEAIEQRCALVKTIQEVYSTMKRCERCGCADVSSPGRGNDRGQCAGCGDDCVVNADLRSASIVVGTQKRPRSRLGAGKGMGIMTGRDQGYDTSQVNAEKRKWKGKRKGICADCREDLELLKILEKDLVQLDKDVRQMNISIMEYTEQMKV